MYFQSSCHFKGRRMQTTQSPQKEQRSSCVYLSFALPGLMVSAGRTLGQNYNTHMASHHPYTRRPSLLIVLLDEKGENIQNTFLY